MQYAMVNNEKVSATPKGVGLCPGCSGEVAARCGDIKMWHWAHRASCSCDFEREPETEWHRKWKQDMPFCDIEHYFKERRADAFYNPLVFEFQNSPISKEDLLERTAYYHDMGHRIVWVFNYTNSPDSFVEDSSQGHAYYRWMHYKPSIMALGNASVFMDIGNNRMIHVMRWHSKGFDGLTISKEGFLRSAENRVMNSFHTVLQYSAMIKDNLDNRVKDLCGKLPDLTGTDEQMEWAHRSRNEVFKAFKDRGFFDGTINQWRATELLYVSYAGFWIDLAKLGDDVTLRGMWALYRKHLLSQEKWLEERAKGSNISSEPI